MGKLKVLKKEKEAVEVNANNARQKYVERRVKPITELFTLMNARLPVMSGTPIFDLLVFTPLWVIAA